MKLSYLLFLISLLLPIFTLGQELAQDTLQKKKKQSLFSLMEYQEVMPVTICADITSMIEEKFDQKERVGLFNFTDSLGEEFTLPIRLEARGKTRLVRCDVPPVMVYFDKPALKEQRVKDYPKLKVVVPCFQDSLAEDLLYRELLVYKLYSLVSDYHFRVQAAELTCLDQISRDTTHILPAFFIESDKEYRKRTDTEEVNEFSINWSDLDPEQAQITAVFQYMISNTDWKIDHQHNLKYFRNDKDEDAPLVLLPYDFDFSGLVNANYAKPNPDYLQESVRQRIYLGKKNKFLNKTIQLFRDKEAAILAAVEEDPNLSEGSKKDIKSFLTPFFECLKKKRKRKRAFRNFEQ